MYSKNGVKHAKLVAALREWEVLQGRPTYQEAVQQLAEFLSIKLTDKEKYCNFGDYALCAADFAIITKDELECCRRQIQARSTFRRKIKSWIRVFATVNFYGREYHALVMPGKVMWELSGITEDTAEEICRELSETAGVSLTVRRG